MLIEYTNEQFKVLIWEGTVTCETRTGQRYTLTSGQQLLLDLKNQTDEVRAYINGLDSNGSAQEGIPSGPETGNDLLSDRGLQELGDMEMTWTSLKPIATEEAERRLEISPLINGFSTPIDTLSVIKRELGLTAPNQELLGNDHSLEDQDVY